MCSRDLEIKIGYKEGFFYYYDNVLEALEQDVHRDGGSLILGDIQVQAGPGSEQTDLAVDVPVPSNSNDSMLLWL